MIFPTGFGAMMTKSLVRKKGRSPLDGYARFFNPVWSRMGREVESGPPGTYYWDSSRELNIYWNYLDQVLVGYDLLDLFPDDRFRIVTTVPGPTGDQSLIRETNSHWKVEISDHLPLIFDLNLPPEENHA